MIHSGQKLNDLFKLFIYAVTLCNIIDLPHPSMLRYTFINLGIVHWLNTSVVLSPLKPGLLDHHSAGTSLCGVSFRQGNLSLFLYIR